MGRRPYNPEKRAWRGRSYRNGGIVRDLREAAEEADAFEDAIEAPPPPTFFVVEVIDLDGGERRHECVGAADAVATFTALYEPLDDRVITMFIEDTEGRRFLPTLVGDVYRTYELPLVECPRRTE